MAEITPDLLDFTKDYERLQNQKARMELVGVERADG